MRSRSCWPWGLERMFQVLDLFLERLDSFQSLGMMLGRGIFVLGAEIEHGV